MIRSRMVRAAMLLCSFVVFSHAGTNVIDSLTFKGDLHQYIVHVPSSYVKGKPVSLVLSLHGFGWHIAKYMTVENFWKKADSVGFLDVYPQGADTSWDSGPFCCGESQWKKRDDVGFIRALVDTLEKHYSIDKNHVYAVGVSNGGMMSNRLGAEAADVFAAVSGICGPLELSPTDSGLHPSRPVSVLDFHNLNDSTIKYAGGGSNVAPAETLAVAAWARVDGCTNGPVKSTYNSQTSIKTWTKNKSPVEVILYTPLTGGHSFPPSNSVLWRDTLWSFFKRHSLDEQTTAALPGLMFPGLECNHLAITYLGNQRVAVVAPAQCQEIQILRINGSIMQSIRMGNARRCELNLCDLRSGVYLIRAWGAGPNYVLAITHNAGDF